MLLGALPVGNCHDLAYLRRQRGELLFVRPTLFLPFWLLRGGLGNLIFEGLSVFFNTEMIVGTVLTVALALVADTLILWGRRRLMPWARRRAEPARLEARDTVTAS